MSVRKVLLIKRNDILRRSMKHIVLFSILIPVWSPIYALEPDEVMIRGRGIFFPLNRFLLIQRGGSPEAVIFSSYNKNERGEFISYLTYKHTPGGWRQEKEDSIGIRKLTWAQRTLGKLGAHAGTISRVKPLRLKDFSLLANPSPDGKHADIYYGSSVDNLDPAVKLAPTPWRIIQDVNLEDARLKWYSSGSPEQTITIGELWRSQQRD